MLGVVVLHLLLELETVKESWGGTTQDHVRRRGQRGLVRDYKSQHLHNARNVSLSTFGFRLHGSFRVNTEVLLRYNVTGQVFASFFF